MSYPSGSELFRSIEQHLLKVEKPGRYTGGEYGIVRKKYSVPLRVALSFPDLYEIGMSNQALKYLYSYLNAHDKIACERVFAPAPDFEKILRDNNLPLSTLETFTAVKEFDLLAFTIGYELSATNILTILDLGKVPILRTRRENDDPVVIAGGPAVTNPYPFSDFLDFVYVGEFEGGFNDITDAIIKAKEAGAGRSELIEMLRAFPMLWYPGKKEQGRKTVRSIWKYFSGKRNLEHLIVPCIQAVQDVGTVEIMRGCPNGCRFCHAGYFYRPCRERPFSLIAEDVFQLYAEGGYREITLSSLSTGDYSGIVPMVKQLNAVFNSRHVSFSLPSLKINTFTLEMFGDLSEVRKSGITFAVETPEIEWQASINKQVSAEKITDILNHAGEFGWKSAKFYFMIGLPHNDMETEVESIYNFVQKILADTKIRIHLNIGTFIPKPHTPYQWSFQLTEQQALEKIMELKRRLKSPHIKFGYHAPFTSYIEGIISRGDERVGQIILAAWKRGARLDAWEEYINRDIWRKVLGEISWNIEQELFSGKDLSEDLVWNDISLGASTAFLKKEYTLSVESRLTDACDIMCEHNCGICGTDYQVEKQQSQNGIAINLKAPLPVSENHSRYIIKFSKTANARYYSHKNLMTVFERALQRTMLIVRFTEGFNPKPRMEFALPLALGIESVCEYLAVDLFHQVDLSDDNEKPRFISVLSSGLPEGLEIIDVSKNNERERKIPSLAASLAGSEYLFSGPSDITGRLSELLAKEKIDNFKCLEYTTQQKLPANAAGMFRFSEQTLVFKFLGTLANTSVYKFLDRHCATDLKNNNEISIMRTAVYFSDFYSYISSLPGAS